MALGLSISFWYSEASLTKKDSFSSFENLVLSLSWLFSIAVESLEI